MFRLILSALVSMLPVVALAQTCGFVRAFSRADEGGTRRVDVFEGRAEPALGGQKPIAFVSDLKVNTDGTRISYKVDDPRAHDGAINDIRNAMLRGRTIAEFEAVAANNWPLPKTWTILSKDIIEKDARTGKPCVTRDNFLVSMTADVSVAGGFDKVGDCDQAKWIDALTIPALVLPQGSTEFEARKATLRNLVVAMTLNGANNLAFGIVGDKGPAKELGEASVAMNRKLNGLPDNDNPSNQHDAIARFQAPRSVVLIFPSSGNRAERPLSAESIKTEGETRFNAWGGKARLKGCLSELGIH